MYPVAFYADSNIVLREYNMDTFEFWIFTDGSCADPDPMKCVYPTMSITRDNDIAYACTWDKDLADSYTQIPATDNAGNKLFATLAHAMDQTEVVVCLPDGPGSEIAYGFDIAIPQVFFSNADAVAMDWVLNLHPSVT